MAERACLPDQGTAHAQEGRQTSPAHKLHHFDVPGGARGGCIPCALEEGGPELRQTNPLAMEFGERSDNFDDTTHGDAAAELDVCGRNKGAEKPIGESSTCVGTDDGTSGNGARENKPRRRTAARECQLLLAGPIWQGPPAERRGQKRSVSFSGQADRDPAGGLRGCNGAGQRLLPVSSRLVANAPSGGQGHRSRAGLAKASVRPTRQSGERGQETAEEQHAEQQGTLRSGLHPSGEESGRQGQGTVPGEVVGLRPDVGGVEAEWDSGRGSGVMGEALQSAGYSGPATVEGLTTNTRSDGGNIVVEHVERRQHVRGERCQRNSCLAIKKKLADVCDELMRTKQERDNLLTTWEEQLNGARRILASDFYEVEEQRDTAWRCAREAKQRRAQDIKVAQRLHEDKAELLDKVAMLQAENAVFKAEVARLLVIENCRRKQEVREMNMCELKLREANRIVKKAERLRAEASLMTEDAARKMAEAQQNVEFARQQADDARQEANDALKQADAASRAIEMNARRAISEAEESAAEAHAEAQLARDEAIAAHAEVFEIRQESNLAKKGQLLAQRQAEKAEQKAQQSKDKLAKIAMCHPTTDRSVDEWAALSRSAAYKAGQRERAYLRAFLQSHSWRAEDIAGALASEGLLEKLFDTREGFQIYFDRVKALLQRLEQEDFGIDFGLFLRYEMRMTTDKILRLTQAACKRYDRGKDFYAAKVLLYHPFRKDLVIKVRCDFPDPRILCSASLPTVTPFYRSLVLPHQDQSWNQQSERLRQG